MLVINLRSSSVGSFQMCEMKYFLNYVLGFSENPNFKTIKGSVCHKALEMLARKKLALQNDEDFFFDPELREERFLVKDIDVSTAIQLAWDHYITDEKKSGYDWTKADFRDCVKWTNNVITLNNGMFNPLKRHIIAPEKYFEFEIDEEWAKYTFEINGEQLAGKLVLKGTVDLLSEHNGIMEMVDWKTGARLDWATGEKKDYEKLLKDFQLRLYHYALSRLYPNLDMLMVTIFFLRDGGPFSLLFTKDDLPETERMIREKFETIRETDIPEIIYPGMMTTDSGYRMSKCEKFCDYRKYQQNGEKALTFEDSLCYNMHSELQQLGLKKVTDKYINLDKLNKYSGGGRDAETKESK